MGFFKKSDEELAENREKIANRLNDSLTKEEAKARAKAERAGINLDNALYVFTCLHEGDSSLKTIFGIIYQDRVVKCQKRITGLVTEETPIKNISSIERSKGLLPVVTIYASGNSINFKVGVESSKIVETVRSLMNSQGTSQTSSSDVATQLEKYAGLLEKGLITREEFEAQKNKLLS